VKSGRNFCLALSAKEKFQERLCYKESFLIMHDKPSPPPAATTTIVIVVVVVV
jgi:hypothetical protein